MLFRSTHLPGSSTFYLGGLICYTPITKLNLCGVSASTLRNGTKSGEAQALEMARGVKKLIKSDISLSTTGVAGEETEKTEKNVYIGFNFGKIEKALAIHFSGSKEALRVKATQSALAFLKQNLTNWIKDNSYQEDHYERN